MNFGIGKRVLVVALAATLVTGCGGADERKAKYLERGKAFIAEENWDKARVEIKNVLQIDPKAAEAYYLLGRIEEKKQDWRKAFGNYSKAVELDPDLVDARSRLAQFYLLQANAYRSQTDVGGEANALGQAQHEVDEILKRDANHSGARSLQAAMLLREGKAEDALALAEKVVRDDPSHGPAAGLLAALYEQAGRAADAERTLVTASKAAEEPLPLMRHLAQLYAREKKNDAAESVLRDIIAARPDDFQPRTDLAQFLAQAGSADKAEAVLRDAVAANPDDAKRYLTLADLLIAKKGSAAASEYLKKSISENPELHELRLGLAQIYERDKQADAAIKIYDEMVARFGEEPPGLVARNRLAAHAAAAGDTAKAEKLVEQVLAENPRDNDALVMQGRLAMQSKEYDAAVASFRSVLRDQPDSVPALHLLAEAQMRKGDMELAGDSLRRAVEVEPLNAEARVKFARYLISRKELARALEQIDAVLKNDASNPDALAAKSELLAAKGDLDAVKVELAKLKEAAPENPEASLRLARVHMAEGDTAAAIAEIDAILARDENNASALMLKTDILAATNDAARLDETINRLKTVAPDNPEGYFRMGRVLRAKGDPAAALAEYERAYALARGAAKDRMLGEIVNTQLASGQSAQALARVQAVLREAPEHEVANYLLGTVHMAREDFVAAEAAFTKQTQLNSASASAYNHLAASREKQGDIEGAVAAYEQGLGALKDNVALQIGLAGLRERQGDFDGAIGVYERIIATQPDNAIAVNNLAALLADHRTDAESLARARELAVKLEPVQRPAMRDTVGWIYYRTGDYAKSIEILESVVNVAPEVPIFQYHLGMAYAKAGAPDKAKASLTKALELGDFAGADDARNTLKQL